MIKMNLRLVFIGWAILTIAFFIFGYGFLLDYLVQDTTKTSGNSFLQTQIEDDPNQKDITKSDPKGPSIYFKEPATSEGSKKDNEDEEKDFIDEISNSSDDNYTYINETTSDDIIDDNNDDNETIDDPDDTNPEDDITDTGFIEERS